ncbi:hypothetical protein DSM3645_03463 [Blastopirellula marina DSM 3645]|uniref:Uncharacterized protein n=1 Tax=Blastopirellula marina DSM 3645 TaxID=314230 RepID=A3ZW06_9BACT|nr:hypothetical protein DSM3645_03463 [Blastopirellula marina DSM 3645]
MRSTVGTVPSAFSSDVAGISIL